MGCIYVILLVLPYLVYNIIFTWSSLIPTIVCQFENVTEIVQDILDYFQEMRTFAIAILNNTFESSF